MARSARWTIENGLYHVMNRGHEKRDIVLDDIDRQEWMRLLDRVARRCEWRVFAYALLHNHFHLFVRTPNADLSIGMHDLQSGYATIFNQRYSRVGALFQGRFKSVLVEDQGHAWTLSRYGHLNPVRANLTRDPATYHWSSHRFFLNPTGSPTWLDWKSVLAEFSARESAARVAYKRYVDAGLQDPPANPFDNVVNGWLLGSQSFIERMRDVPDDSEPTASTTPLVVTAFDLLEIVAKAFDVTVEMIQRRGGQNNVARDAAVWLLREVLEERVDAVAELLGGVGKSAISETFRRAVRRRNQDEAFRRLVDEIRGQVVQSSIFAG